MVSHGTSFVIFGMAFLMIQYENSVAEHAMMVPAIILFSVLCSSCNFFSSDSFTEYLKKNETEIEVVESRFQSEYPSDGSDVVSIPSNDDCKITYVVRNPLGLSITPVVTNKADTQSALASLSNPYSFETSDDNNYVIVTLTKEMLVAIEMGGDVSPVINLTASGYGAEIPEYSYRIRANAPPLFVEGACVMIDTAYKTTSSKGHYVLCFNLPEIIFDSTGNQCDIDKIYITGLDSVTGQSIDYTIKLVDAKGLSSFVAVNTQSLKLGAPTTNITSQEELAGGSYSISLTGASGTADYFTAVITAPASTNNPTASVEGASVVYKVYKVTNSNKTMYSSGYSVSSYSVNFTAGTYLIESYAHKDGYVDSEIQSWSFTVSN